MTPENETVLYIPRMFNYETPVDVKRLLGDIVGMVRRVDFIGTQKSKDDIFDEKIDGQIKAAFVYISLYPNDYTKRLLECINEPNSQGFMHYFYPSGYYWRIFKNHHPVKDTLMNNHQIVENGLLLQDKVRAQSDQIDALIGKVDAQSETIDLLLKQIKTQSSQIDGLTKSLEEQHELRTVERDSIYKLIDVLLTTQTKLATQQSGMIDSVNYQLEQSDKMTTFCKNQQHENEITKISFNGLFQLGENQECTNNWITSSIKTILKKTEIKLEIIELEDTSSNVLHVKNVDGVKFKETELFEEYYDSSW